MMEWENYEEALNHNIILNMVEASYIWAYMAASETGWYDLLTEVARK